MITITKLHIRNLGFLIFLFLLCITPAMARVSSLNIAVDNFNTYVNSPFEITNSNSNVTVVEPSNLIAKTFSNSQINLSWKDNSQDETGFSIQLKIGASGTYSEVAQVAAGITSYDLKELTPLTTYYIKVMAISGANTSNYSNEVIVATTLASWNKASNPIWTTWGEGINDPTGVLQEYPRPQMMKENWQNLNGLWDVWEGNDINFSGSKSGILVPFPIQSALSGVKQNWHRFTYEKYIGIPKEWNGKRTILHFGAVDFQAEIFINGQSVLLHKGGYDPFSIDITDKVTAGNTYKLNVKVWDPNTSEGSPGPQGKQTDEQFNVPPAGIFYTPTGGIWQTVWMESVPNVYIKDIKLVPNIDNGTLQLTVTIVGNGSGITFEALAKDGNTVVNTVSGAVNTPITISIPNQKLWSPESPFLYDLNIVLKNGENVIENVQSYFGMRKISLGKVKGITKMLLNNQPVFQMGPLDQGFWPDGIYTPPSEEAILFDLQGMKNLGYNMVRKHIKVEPARWYYNADKLGLLVWQDVVSGHNNTTAQRDQYELEMRRMIQTHWNYPSVIMWVPFNEQWGMFDSVRISNIIENLDPSRLVNENSGCCGAAFSTVGHMKDYHYYSAPSCPSPDDNRALANGEFAGVVLRKPGNMWDDNAWTTWARVVETDNEFTDVLVDYANILKNLRDYEGMSAAVLTQWTDVEAEINGHYTYDRKIFKGDFEKIKTALESTHNNDMYYLHPPSGYAVFEAYNVAGIFIRHQEGKAHMDNIIEPLDDAYWKVVPGLAGVGISLQSLNSPDKYLRHSNAQMMLQSNDGSQVFKEDATFYLRSGLSNSSRVSFESFNFPGRFIRHRGSLLYSEAIVNQLDRDDATFYIFSDSTIGDNGSGEGLYGNYFNGMNFGTPVFSRKDATINFNWGDGSPNIAVNTDRFSARWTGQIQPKYTGEYTFFVNSDNGRRLWINNQLVIDAWIGDWGVEYSGKITLEAGKRYDIKLEYFEEVGGADCKLEWSHSSQFREVIPASQLYASAMPIVNITFPSNNSRYLTGAKVDVNCTASDPDGSIAKVDFYNGATLLASVTTAPYSYSFTETENGTYNVKVVATDNLGVKSDVATTNFIVSASLGINEQKLSKEIIIKNPVDQTLHIISKINLSHADITIYDMQGRLLGNLKNQGNDLDVRNLTSGVYIINIQVGDAKYVAKFIKK
ncbi:T9SS type A sorting domain-containing protein [Flavobacterium franklandianum]|uniref:T9SS type A sorting domain-containing protein n=2 Tax=Flavobacterium franklandianum TaxID=2594430 RepID=A0A553CMA5_9FLAO|nr:T9SS type A sorting domain-containing protein [Flavobacterium franklandianum]